MNFSFLQPWFLLLLLLLPFLWRRGRANSALQWPGLRAFTAKETSFKIKMLHLLPLLQWLAIVLLIIALARPQKQLGVQTVGSQGIDIVLSTDVSGSMLAQDFHPNRLEAAKQVAADFIDARAADRIGLVIFAGESFTLCPITSGHTVLKNMLRNAAPGMLQDGTAIGMGLATAVERLRESKGKSKVIVLLTDGINNAGAIDPVTAAEVAMQFGVKVYTIGMGSAAETVPLQGYGNYRQGEIDEPLMQKIAEITGGRFYRATDGAALRNVYAEIDRLEKTHIETQRYQPKQELYYPLLRWTLLLIVFCMLMRFTVLKSVTA